MFLLVFLIWARKKFLGGENCMQKFWKTKISYSKAPSVLIFQMFSWEVKLLNFINTFNSFIGENFWKFFFDGKITCKNPKLVRKYIWWKIKWGRFTVAFYYSHYYLWNTQCCQLIGVRQLVRFSCKINFNCGLLYSRFNMNLVKPATSD